MTKFKKAPRLSPVRVQDSQCKSVCSDDNCLVIDENGKEGNLIIRKKYQEAIRMICTSIYLYLVT